MWARAPQDGRMQHRSVPSCVGQLPHQRTEVVRKICAIVAGATPRSRVSTKHRTECRGERPNLTWPHVRAKGDPATVRTGTAPRTHTGNATHGFPAILAHTNARHKEGDRRRHNAAGAPRAHVMCPEEIRHTVGLILDPLCPEPRAHQPRVVLLTQYRRINYGRVKGGQGALRIRTRGPKRTPKAAKGSQRGAVERDKEGVAVLAAEVYVPGVIKHSHQPSPQTSPNKAR